MPSRAEPVQNFDASIWFHGSLNTSPTIIRGLLRWLFVPEIGIVPEDWSVHGSPTNLPVDTLAVVATVIERAREDTKSIDDFVSSLRGRIQSIAGTQTLLSQGRGQGVSIADLVRTELRPYATGTNTSVDGPPVYLLPAASHALAMVVHELATNAAKYGALSQSGGHLSVRWKQTADFSSAPMLKIEWKETGGPQVAAPAREGYGSSVIRDLLAYELAGRVDLVFETDGVRCTIEVPGNAEAVVDRNLTSRS